MAGCAFLQMLTVSGMVTCVYTEHDITSMQQYVSRLQDLQGLCASIVLLMMRTNSQLQPCFWTLYLHRFHMSEQLLKMLTANLLPLWLQQCPARLLMKASE